MYDPWFRDEAAALAKLEEIVWPDGPICSHCGARDRIGYVVGKGARIGLRFCNHCRRQFRVTIGTVFERSHVPLHKWFIACVLWRQNVNARQIHQEIGVNYITARRIVKLLDDSLAKKVADALASSAPRGPTGVSSRRLPARRQG